MVFSSHLFVYYFLPLALLLYYASPRPLKHLTLTLLSYVFYGWANPAFLILILVSTAIDYGCGLAIAGPSSAGLEPGTPRSARQRSLVAVSVVTNLGLLGFFKYANFFVDNVNALRAWRGFEPLMPGLDVVLPLGISFYTFQSMSYTIDLYRGHARPLKNPIDFACYVSMFPQLVAGPIIRFSEISEQLRERRHDLDRFARGVAVLALGIAKKVLLANPCGRVADTAFGAGSLGVVDAWYGVVAYAMQIYFDFSGYSDMAVGLGLMLGFVFPRNFDAPYRSASITEFWRRWHISLSSWLRDYLYLPLGGNRRGPARTYVNLMIVMLLGGLWHGAAWNFVAWGALHGGLLALERWRGKRPLVPGPRPLRVAVTFALVLVGWVLFRAESLGHAAAYLADMFGLGAVQPGAALLRGELYAPAYFGRVLLAALVVWGAPQAFDWTSVITRRRALACLVVLWLALVELTAQSYNPFIYFIF